jgi:hypothetical protein
MRIVLSTCQRGVLCIAGWKASRLRIASVCGLLLIRRRGKNSPAQDGGNLSEVAGPLATENK